MSSGPRVSAIIPVFNRERLVGRAIRSALAQTYRELEVIVVDDGSTDGTPQVVASFGDAVRTFSQSRRGPYAARNLALQNALGEYVAFLDSDDIWKPHRLERQVQLLDADPGIGLVFSDGEIIEEGTEAAIGTFFEYYGKPVRKPVFAHLLRRNFIPQSSVLTRMRCFREFGPFLEMPLGADYHKWLQIALAYRIDFVDDLLFSYGVHESNISRDRVTQYRCLLGTLEALAEITSDPRVVKMVERKRTQTLFKTGCLEMLSGRVLEGTRSMAAALWANAGDDGIVARGASIAVMLAVEAWRPLRRRLLGMRRCPVDSSRAGPAS